MEKEAILLPIIARKYNEKEYGLGLESVLLIIINMPSLFAELVGGHACDFFEHLTVVALILKAAHTADFREGGNPCQQEGFALLHTQLI